MSLEQGSDRGGGPDVSIVIANWNAKSHLSKCLSSIEASDASVTTETIVVDNASADGSAAMVRERFPWVALLENTTNLGFARANNLGIARTTGRYLCLMNSDVVVDRRALGLLVRFMDARPRVGLVGPRVFYPDGTLQPTCRHFPAFVNLLARALALDNISPRLAWYDKVTLAASDRERSVDVLTGCLCMARQSALPAVGLLDERFFFYSEDVDWCRRFHAAGWDVCFYPEAEAVHAKSASSSAAPRRFAIEMQRSQTQYFRKHYSRPAVVYFMLVGIFHHIARLAVRSVQYVVQPSRRPILAARIGDHAACLRILLPRSQKAASWP